MSTHTSTDQQLGRFLRWDAPVSIDARRRLIHFLPKGSKSAEEIVEIPNADVPSDEALDIRCSWY